MAFAHASLNQANERMEGVLLYPYLFTEWRITYKPFLGKKRTVTRLLMSNLVRDETHFSDQRLDLLDVETTSHPVHWFLPAKWSEDQALRKGREFLRRYYVHRVRSWSVPQIEQVQGSITFLPYEIFWKQERSQSQLFLRETFSRAIDRVDRYPEIDHFLKGKEVSR